MKQQRRYTQVRDGLKVTRAEGKPPVVNGYGAVYWRAGDPGTEYWLWDDMVERIVAGAFERAMREDDVRSLFNHDANIVLGRNRAGTLKLRTDERGLIYEATLPDTQLARDQVLAPIDRGDVSGSSFMFTTRKVVWIEELREGKRIYIRELHDVQLWEVGPVVFPAYAGTTTSVRGEQKTGFPLVLSPDAAPGLRAMDADAARQEWQAWIASGGGNRAEADRVEMQFADMRRREAEHRLDELKL